MNLCTATQARSESAYREALTGDDTDIRIGMLAAHLIGMTFARHIVKAGRLAEMSAEELRLQLSRVLPQILFAWGLFAKKATRPRSIDVASPASAITRD